MEITIVTEAKAVLVTGGAGFIGSHTCMQLVECGFSPIVVDDLSNGSQIAVERASVLTKQEIPFVHGDVRNGEFIRRVIKHYKVSGVIHFAAYKAVANSIRDPLAYFDNNIGGLVSVLQAMRGTCARNFVFSSSATVYGLLGTPPVDEKTPTGVINPYGRTKLMGEEIIGDACISDSNLNAVILRYFNPIGAHESGDIGEDPRGVPENLMPYISQVAVGQREQLRVFGGDWPTPDGTGVRDYIHVMDLADAHVVALKHLKSVHCGTTVFNVGTGRGTSVLELIHAFERVTERKVPYEIVARRPGDVAALWADVTKAKTVLEWRAQRDLDAMCRDAWRWQTQNPSGY